MIWLCGTSIGGAAARSVHLTSVAVHNELPAEAAGMWRAEGIKVAKYCPEKNLLGPGLYGVPYVFGEIERNRVFWRKSASYGVVNYGVLTVDKCSLWDRVWKCITEKKVENHLLYGHCTAPDIAKSPKQWVRSNSVNVKLIDGNIWLLGPRSNFGHSLLSFGRPDTGIRTGFYRGSLVSNQLRLFSGFFQLPAQRLSLGLQQLQLVRLAVRFAPGLVREFGKVGNGILNVASIAGNSVGSDGYYQHRNGNNRIYAIEPSNFPEQRLLGPTRRSYYSLKLGSLNR